ncbi:ABC-F family ATP-binding cassette domain-containing protein [Mycobacterium vicinigordonae]|uniref:ABC-F family ATP-binding cassette domain-containing protein n=1 Tax=Mycobacterium vicinigordonae TaxID=1719132 RepID=A0A7D6E057_9MYCO|nr:ABC-F family ATP-binding cassette domain-containing protein [Mycobacterium vicinigordonae]QLL05246.1 ABC-F family ATP-binding cassette domain-containing protein [Mycobacterium vicinigordonae]
MSDARVVCSNLSFSWPDGTRVLEHMSFTFDTGRTGLVAPNGAGKTTLLELIAGRLLPDQGVVSVHGVLGYLPQRLPFAAEPSSNLSVAEVLGVAPVLAALDALDAGDVRDEVFTAIGDDWNVGERVGVELERVGLGHLALDRPLRTISGGEIVALGLAAQLLRRPDVLVLDEPTNNLDVDQRQRLYRVLDGYTGCLVLASHDRSLLDRMDRIAELRVDEIRLYGGDFTFYERVVERDREVARQGLRNAELDLERQKRARQSARERAARRNRNAVRNRRDLGLPKALLDKRQSSAQESAGRAYQTHTARIEAASARVDEVERELRAEPVLVVDLPDTQVPAGRTVFAGSGIQILLDGTPLFAEPGVDLVIRGPERIALTGPNGAGKSTLLRAISGQVAVQGSRAVFGPVGYLPQRQDVLSMEQTVAENLAAYAPAMSQADRMTRLARFLFPGPGAHQTVGTLSGGELLRATLACLLSAEPPPQLLLLDEPTNNLDLPSVAQLQSALTAYQGALVIVSHDERFLHELDLDRRLLLEGGRLRVIATRT